MLNLISIALFLWFQGEPPLKPASQFEVITNYQLKKKPQADNPVIVFEKSEDKHENTTDLLPFLSIQLKVKRWHPVVEQIRVVDGLGKTILKKKFNDPGIYDFELGYVDDMKDDVTSGKFFVNFMEGKKVVEVITITVENDGAFLVNGEKRGKF